MTAKKMTPEQIRAKTPATEKWVQDALLLLGRPALDNIHNRYAYELRLLELRFPRLAALAIPLFAKAPRVTKYPEVLCIRIPL